MHRSRLLRLPTHALVLAGHPALEHSARRGAHTRALPLVVRRAPPHTLVLRASGCEGRVGARAHRGLFSARLDALAVESDVAAFGGALAAGHCRFARAPAQPSPRAISRWFPGGWIWRTCLIRIRYEAEGERASR